MYWDLIIICIVSCTKVYGDSYDVVISGDTNVVIGGTAHFKAQIYNSYGPVTTGTFDFEWEDNAIPKHTFNQSKTPGVSYWNVTYDRDIYAPGPYNIEVVVHTRTLYIFYPKVASQRVPLNVTYYLSGEIVLFQSNITRKRYVASNSSLIQSIQLCEPDMAHLKETNQTVRTFWFVDCTYIGPFPGFNYSTKYDDPEHMHYIEALVVASNETLPNIITALNNVTNTTNGTNLLDSWLASFSTTPKSEFCLNTTLLPLDKSITYGYFQKKITVKAPIRINRINGSNWLQDGEMLNMTVTCNGSGPYTYCIRFFKGLFNATGTETCPSEFTLRNCSIPLKHLFLDSPQYTLVVIISNAVSRLVTPIGVNIYKVTKQPQLSIIVVPVAFSLVAVVLIVFGVAYYYQSRRSLPVETADFDFANQTNDMEHKSFRERLQESITNSFFKSHEIPGEENVWSPRKKYGSMQ